MKLPKEETEATTRAITTLFIGSALLLGFMAMMTTPQMIGSAYAASEQGSEHACKELPGATLERGQCEAPAIEKTTFTCKEVFGQTPTPSADNTCTASKTVKASDVKAAENECKAAGGTPKPPENAGPGEKKVTCTYPATKTTTFTCSNPEIQPVNKICTTKPGDRSEEEEEL